jgi:hypothetical protein
MFNIPYPTNGKKSCTDGGCDVIRFAIPEVSVQLKGKGNIVPVHATKAIGGAEVYLHSFLSPALDRVSGQLYALAALSLIPTE